MAFHVFLFLLVVFLCLVLLWRLCWLYLQPSHSRGGAKRTGPHLLRHRRAAQTIVPPVVSPPLPRWVEGQLPVLYVPGVR